ncbi:MAG: right-handed parallel beta-helix repeat-containing protein, partial [Deltaproteobacteria bacterium]|nr:right-handed parallel beta-helix repeat-containing protein [Deltaproteobacteria bacterium]
MAVVTARHLAALLVLVLVFGSLSCGGESSPQGGGGTGGQELCPAPNRLLEDGTCLPPGVQDNGCPAGELGLEDGSCQPAGGPAELCADGFEPLEQGCEPILPPEPCEPGLMAVPGDTACREVAPCGQGQWGDIPIDGTTEHVDGAYAGGSSDGTADHPWTTISEAITAAAPGALVAIAAGSYAEGLDIAGKPVTLWGVCPAEVEVVGSATAMAAVVIRAGADGTEVRSLAIRGDAVGLALSGSQSVVLDRLWMHDNASRGVVVEETLGPTTVTLSGVLLEQNHEVGVYVVGSDATIEGTVVRNTLPRASDQTAGRGINIQHAPNTAERGSVTLHASLLEQNRDAGVYVSGSDAIIEGTVVRNTMPQASNQGGGQGIRIVHGPNTAQRASVTLRASQLEQNHYVGVYVSSSDATIESTTVRSTMPRASDQLGGNGISSMLDPDTAGRASVTLHASLLEQNHEVGLVVFASDATIEGTVVRNTLPRP